jgi:hypothetical protein
MTTKKPSYYELLQHPNWQRKRLVLLEQAGWRCTYCDADDRSLHIHHTYYEKGLAPWEYPDESLEVLCEPCHWRAEDLRMLMQRQLGKMGVGADLEQLLGYALALEALNDRDVVIEVRSFEAAEGIGDAWGLAPEEIIEALHECQIDGHALEALSRAKARKLWRGSAGAPVTPLQKDHKEDAADGSR